MKDYIDNIIPRLKQFSEGLDKKASFIDRPWVILDENSNQQKYIFKGNGELIMSLNGNVTMGRWEYLASAKSLLIDRLSDKILLNQDFVDPAVMLLRKDGVSAEKFMLANELLIPNLDIEYYLRQLYIKRNNIKMIHLEDGQIIEVHRTSPYEEYLPGSLVTMEGKLVEDGLVISGKSRILIKGSKINKLLELKEYKTTKGVIQIEQKHQDVVRNGDRVFIAGLTAPDGKYKLRWFKSIEVKDGVVV